MAAARKHSFSKCQTNSATNLKSIRVNIILLWNQSRQPAKVAWGQRHSRSVINVSETGTSTVLDCLFIYLDQQHPWAEQSQFLLLCLNVKFFVFCFLFFSFFDLLCTCWKRFQTTTWQLFILFHGGTPHPKKQNRKYLHSIRWKVDSLSHAHSSFYLSTVAW